MTGKAHRITRRSVGESRAGETRRIGGLRAIGVKVAFALLPQERMYLLDWSLRGVYGRGVIEKLGPRVFELPPTGLSLYLIARLRERVGDVKVHVYPVGFSSDVPKPPDRARELFSKRKLRNEELEFLRGLSLRAY